MRRKTIIPICFLCLFAFPSFSQMTIGASSIPLTGSVLDLESTNQGLLFPRVSLSATTTWGLLGSGITGMVVYNTNASISGVGAMGAGLYYWSNTTSVWSYIQNGPTNFWSLSGNTGITQPAVPATYGTSTFGTSENWIGNKDAKDFTIGTSNIERMRILSNGNVGIGTSAPTRSLVVVANNTNNVQTIQNNNIAGYSSIDMYNNSGSLSSTFGFGNSSSAFPFTSRGFVNTYGNDFVVTNTAAGTTTTFVVSGQSASPGYIGIGTATPGQPLEVASTTGTVRIDGLKSGNTYNSSSTAGTSTLVYSNNTTGDLYSLPTVSNSILVTNSAGVPSWSGSALSSAINSNNGLTYNVGSPSLVQLGGSLVQSTTITLPSTYSLIHNLTGTGDFQIQKSGTDILHVYSTNSNVGINIAAAAADRFSVGGTTLNGINASTANAAAGSYGVSGSNSNSTGYGIIGANSSASGYAVYANNSTGVTGAGLKVNGTSNLMGVTTLGTGSAANGSLIYNNSTNTNTIAINSGVTSASYALTLPTAVASANNQVLASTTGGVLSWLNTTAITSVQNGVLLNTTTSPATGTSPFIELGGSLVNPTTITDDNTNTLTLSSTANNANPLSIIANNLTSGNGLSVSSTATLQSGGSLLNLNSTGPNVGGTNVASVTGNGTAVGNILNLSGTSLTTGSVIAATAGTTTGTAVSITANGLTQGTGLSLTSTGAIIASGSLASFTANLLTTGNGINLSVTGMTTGNGINETANSLSTGNGMLISSSSTGITTGSLLNLSATGAIGNASGSLLNVNSTGVNTAGYLAMMVGNAATTGGILNLSGSGLTSGAVLNAIAGTTTGNAVNITANGLTTGTGFSLTSTGTIIAAGSLATFSANSLTTANGINLSLTGMTTGNGVNETVNSLTTGNGIAVASSSGSITTGSLLSLSSTGVISNASGSLLNINSSVANTAGNLATITGNTTTTANILNLSGTALTSGSVLNATAGTTTGNAINLSANGLTSGNAINVTSTSTAGTANTDDALVNLIRSGANAGATHTAYGVYSIVSNTGTASTNIGGYFSASGATNNYGLVVPSTGGNVGIGTSSPAYTLDVWAASATNPVRMMGLQTGSTSDSFLTVSAGVIRNVVPTPKGITGTIGAGFTIPGTATGTYYNTGSYITLPPGKYMVQVYLMLQCNNSPMAQSGTAYQAGSFFIKTFFADQALGTTTGFSVSPATNTTDVTADITGTAKLISGSLAQGTGYNPVSGFVFINNTSGASKKYYLWAGWVNLINILNSNSLLLVGGTNFAEDNIVAFPIY